MSFDVDREYNLALPPRGTASSVSSGEVPIRVGLPAVQEERVTLLKSMRQVSADVDKPEIGARTLPEVRWDAVPAASNKSPERDGSAQAFTVTDIPASDCDESPDRGMSVRDIVIGKYRQTERDLFFAARTPTFVVRA